MSNATVTPDPMAAPDRRPANLAECVYTDLMGRRLTESELIAELMHAARCLYYSETNDWFVPALRERLVYRGELPNDQNFVFWIQSRFISLGNTEDLLSLALHAMGGDPACTPNAERIVSTVTRTIDAAEFVFERKMQLREARLALPGAIAAQKRGEWVSAAEPLRRQR